MAEFDEEEDAGVCAEEYVNVKKRVKELEKEKTPEEEEGVRWKQQEGARARRLQLA